jgi:threonine synthase
MLTPQEWLEKIPCKIYDKSENKSYLIIAVSKEGLWHHDTITMYDEDSFFGDGRYEVDESTKSIIEENFKGYFANETETAATLRKFYEELGYLADTHTSVALNCAEKYISETGDNNKMVVVSTASPYKFAADVYKSITEKEASDGTAALDELSALTGTEISYPLKDLDKRQVNFKKVISKEDMLEEVYNFM